MDTIDIEALPGKSIYVQGKKLEAKFLNLYANPKYPNAEEIKGIYSFFASTLTLKSSTFKGLYAKRGAAVEVINYDLETYTRTKIESCVF